MWRLKIMFYKKSLVNLDKNSAFLRVIYGNTALKELKNLWSQNHCIMEAKSTFIYRVGRSLTQKFLRPTLLGERGGRHMFWNYVPSTRFCCKTKIALKGFFKIFKYGGGGAAHISAGAWRGQKRTSDPLEIQAIVNCLTQVLGTELESLQEQNMLLTAESSL